MSNPIRIEPGSEAWNMLAEMMARADKRAISITPRPGAVQLKWGGGTWTTPLSTAIPVDDKDVRQFVHADCGHLLCKRCGGHKEWREADDEPVAHSCQCCKICGRDSH